MWIRPEATNHGQTSGAGIGWVSATSRPMPAWPTDSKNMDVCLDRPVLTMAFHPACKSAAIITAKNTVRVIITCRCCLGDASPASRSEQEAACTFMTQKLHFGLHAPGGGKPAQTLRAQNPVARHKDRQGIATT